eukprot:UN13001
MVDRKHDSEHVLRTYYFHENVRSKKIFYFIIFGSPQLILLESPNK